MCSEDILLVYDKECPVCNNYCQLVQIRKTVGKLKIINARYDSGVMKEITSAGLDIDQGMILKIGVQLYSGAEAIHALALISSRSGFFNRLNYWLFKSKNTSRILYPILKFFRNFLLKTLGKTKINNLNIDKDDKF